MRMKRKEEELWAVSEARGLCRCLMFLAGGKGVLREFLLASMALF